MKPYDSFDLKFSSREVTAWGALALLKRMLDGLDFRAGVQSWQLPPPGSNRCCRPKQRIEQMIASVWCGAAQFAQADITRLDATLVRLFDRGTAADHKATVGLFQRFDQADSSQVQSSSFRWLFDKLRLNSITLDVDATVLTRTLSALRHKALAVGAFWDTSPGKSARQTFRLAEPRKRRPWFEGRWANACGPLTFANSAKNPHEQTRFNE